MSAWTAGRIVGEEHWSWGFIASGNKLDLSLGKTLPHPSRLHIANNWRNRAAQKSGSEVVRASYSWDTGWTTFPLPRPQTTPGTQGPWLCPPETQCAPVSCHHSCPCCVVSLKHYPPNLYPRKEILPQWSLGDLFLPWSLPWVLFLPPKDASPTSLSVYSSCHILFFWAYMSDSLPDGRTCVHSYALSKLIFMPSKHTHTQGRKTLKSKEKWFINIY